MIISIGIDVVEIARIEGIVARRGSRFIARVFTEAEIDYCEHRASRLASYAARFAAKEALMKALGTGWTEGIAWRDIEVIPGQTGAPTLRLTGRALDRFKQIGARKAHVSLSHSRDIALAEVLLES